MANHIFNGFFKKNATISVKEKIDSVFPFREVDGKVEICNGNIIVKNPKESGKPAVIIQGKDMKLMIDGKEVKENCEVYEQSKVEVLFEVSKAQRYVDFIITPDKMKVFVSIKYLPETVYKLKDKPESTILTLECEERETSYPPLFSQKEINDELEKLGVKYGIIGENLLSAVANKDGCSKFLIAEGIYSKNDTDDTLDLKFDNEKILENEKENNLERIDYRNISSITSVKKGAVVALRYKGVLGQDGKDIYGSTVKRKKGKVIRLSAGEGCILSDENTVEAAVEGKPCIKNNTFYVYPIHELHRDVNMKNGNVKFIGDVRVFGSVTEGMTVEAGNTIDIEKSVENAKITATGDIRIKGNVIISTVSAGGQDVLILSHINELNELKVSVNNIIEAMVEIKKFNLLGHKASDGEIINALIDSKFKKLRSLCMSIILRNKKINMLGESKVVDLLREKLMGMAPLKIKHFSELDSIVQFAELELNQIQVLLALPVNVSIAYCQDSEIISSGSIYITGKGEYVSNLTAHEGIYFTMDGSIARGGTLKAENEIKCKTVGGPGGGAATHLIVAQKGQIHIEAAYENTIITVGHKEFVIETPSKNIHAYLDDKGELIVDKLKL